MDTYEARLTMRDLAHKALEIVERQEAGTAVTGDDRASMRAMAAQTRSLLSDAGFPAEAAWRAIQRASIGLETAFDEPDRSYWTALAGDLRGAIETLDNLVSVSKRDADIHIVG